MELGWKWIAILHSNFIGILSWELECGFTGIVFGDFDRRNLSIFFYIGVNVGFLDDICCSLHIKNSNNMRKNIVRLYINIKSTKSISTTKGLVEGKP